MAVCIAIRGKEIQQVENREYKTRIQITNRIILFLLLRQSSLFSSNTCDHVLDVQQSEGQETS